MIPHGVDIFLALRPIDLRWSFDRLAGVAREQLGRRPRCGALFVFYNRRRTSLKILFFDGTGLCQLYKRLDRGTIQIPDPEYDNEMCVTLSERELDDLLDGIAVEQIEPRRAKRGRRTLH